MVEQNLAQPPFLEHQLMLIKVIFSAVFCLCYNWYNDIICCWIFTMNDPINYKNNPLHGVSLKNLLIEMVDHYGFSILFAYLNINCFKTNPSIESSVKFLKKTDWAREKVEGFYLYEFKNLPRASSEQFEMPPRDRIVPEDQTPSEPAELSLEDAGRLREKRAKKATSRGQSAGHHAGSGKTFAALGGINYSNNRDNKSTQKDDRVSSNSSNAAIKSDSDPWANWRK